MNCFSCLYFHEKKKAPKDSDNTRRTNGELTGRDNNKTHPGKLRTFYIKNLDNFQLYICQGFISLDFLVLAEIPTKTEVEKNKNNDAEKEISNNIAAQTFTFRELATATKNFRQECLIGEGGFGKVYKGRDVKWAGCSWVIHVQINIGLYGHPYLTIKCFVQMDDAQIHLQPKWANPYGY